MPDAQIIHLMLPVIQISCPVVMDTVIVIIQTEPVKILYIFRSTTPMSLKNARFPQIQ